MTRPVRRDSDTVLAGMILVIVAASGQFLYQLARVGSLGNLIGAPGLILFFADLALVAGLIMIALGVFRLLRRAEARLYP